MRWSDGSYLEDQDHWWLSGIHRSEWLKPAERAVGQPAPCSMLIRIGFRHVLEADMSSPSGMSLHMCPTVQQNLLWLLCPQCPYRSSSLLQLY